MGGILQSKCAFWGMDLNKILEDIWEYIWEHISMHKVETCVLPCLKEKF